MADLLVFIIVGLVVGALARLFMPGPDRIGILGTIGIGMLGAIIGGYLWEGIFGPEVGVAWIGSVLVGMALLWVYRRLVAGRRV